MIEINLLARSYSRANHKTRALKLALTSMVVACGLIMLLHGCLVLWSLKENSREQHWLWKLQSLNSVNVKLLNQRRLISQSAASMLNRLHDQHLINLELFDKIFSSTSNEMHLSEMTRVQNKIFFKGYANTAVSLEAFTKDISVAKHLQKTQLLEIKTMQDSQQLSFQIQVMHDAILQTD